MFYSVLICQRCIITGSISQFQEHYKEMHVHSSNTNSGQNTSTAAGLNQAARL